VEQDLAFGAALLTDCPRCVHDHGATDATDDCPDDVETVGSESIEDDSPDKGADNEDPRHMR